MWRYTVVLPFCRLIPAVTLFLHCLTRLEYEGSAVGKILDAVTNCTSLVQLYLIVGPRFESRDSYAEWSWDARLFSDRMLRLVDSLPKLVCLYRCFDVPEYYCPVATKVLVETVTPKRPSFRGQLLSQSRANNFNSTFLPFVHARSLIRYKENFSALPYEGY